MPSIISDVSKKYKAYWAGGGCYIRPELWYDPASNRFYVTGANAAGDRVIDVFDDATYSLQQSIDLTALGFGASNLHSVAVDPLNKEIFVPITASSATFPNTECPSGCVAVFAESLPEPPSSLLVVTAVAGLMVMTRALARRGGHSRPLP